MGYAWAMKITHELRYDAPVAEVYAMLGDPGFRAQVCEALHVVRQDIGIQETARGMDVRLDMVQRTEGIPSFARKIVGEESRVVQIERWDAEQGADLEVQIPGKPGGITGRITLRPDGPSRTVESFEGEATIKVPLVGGKLEGLIQKLFTGGMDAEREVGARWLAGERA